RRLSWFHAALLSVVLGYFSFGLLGFTPTVINGISMEPGMHTGDVVITRDVDPHEIEVGDVIRFRRGNGSVVHRVIEVRIGADGEPEFVTQGDNNPAPDSPVRADDVVGVFAFRIPKVGWPIYWIRSVLS
ncbi:MAG TPA: signal peptidase I, partial [Acidimicrobiales bacterium]